MESTVYAAHLRCAGYDAERSSSLFGILSFLKRKAQLCAEMDLSGRSGTNPSCWYTDTCVGNCAGVRFCLKVLLRLQVHSQLVGGLPGGGRPRRRLLVRVQGPHGPRAAACHAAADAVHQRAPGCEACSCSEATCDAPFSAGCSAGHVVGAILQIVMNMLGCEGGSPT